MKIYPFKIPKPQQKNLIVQVDKVSRFYDRLHQHAEIQVSYIEAGRGKLLVSDKVHTYQPGDVLILGGGIPHLFQTEEDPETESHMISFFFKEDAFGSQFFDLRETEAIRPLIKRSVRGVKLSGKFGALRARFLELPLQTEFVQFLKVLELMYLLAGKRGKSLTDFRFPKEIGGEEGERLQELYDYVLRHYREEITLEAIAQKAYMTPNAFCRYFKQRTNKTFFQFLIELRIEHACELLKHNRELSVAQVAFESGFRTLSNFNRKFKAIKQLTPGQFQKKAHLSR